ncbi:hypothetical protein K3756_10750 [Sulfitobacter sp. S190]|nr:hypothetical protein K3756_10750 [Sulfitobacter sp. S190]
MQVAATSGTARPIGYFVHHQGRGHAQRCAAIVNALPISQKATIFCARTDIFPPLRAGIHIEKIPSLFEPTGFEDVNDTFGQPETVHCAPLGWPGIRSAMGIMANWFHQANPALMIVDVSAEVAQLARLCSVPCVKILQHGDRSDIGHRAAYAGCVGLIAPCARALAQDDWNDLMAKIHFAAGIGTAQPRADKRTARAALDLPKNKQVVLVISGGGGNGFGSAPLGVGARATPDKFWVTVGKVETEWHATEPANLRHDGWVDTIRDYIAAADTIVASTGNTTCHDIMAAGRPWIAVPEWRYFDEQVEKANALGRIGAAHVVPAMPSSAHGWRKAIALAHDTHDPAVQRSLIDPDAPRKLADWLARMIAALTPPTAAAQDRALTPEISI